MFAPFQEEMICREWDDNCQLYQSEDEDYINADPIFIQENPYFLQTIRLNKKREEIDLIQDEVQFKSQQLDLAFPWKEPIKYKDQCPTIEEINIAIERIKQKFPDTNIISLSSKLYHWIKSRNKEESQSISSYPRQPTAKSDHSSEKDEKQSDWLKDQHYQKSKVIKLGQNKFILTNKGLIPKKESLYERFHKIKTMKQYRTIEREIAARAFCDRGYGIPKLRLEIGECGINIQIDDKRYKAVSCGFVTQTYRRMEKFMIQDCQQNMKGTSSNQLKVLYTILLNCRDNFQQEQAKTYVKFVRLTYQLAQVQISLEQTMKLYNRFIESLYHKIKQQKYNPQDGTFQLLKQSKSIGVEQAKPNLDKLWTRQRQKQFYTIYLKERTLSGVRDYFKEKYDPIKESQFTSEYPKTILSKEPKNKSNYLSIQSSVQFSFFQTITDLRVITSKFHRTIRGGLRRIEYFAKKNPRTIKLLKASDNVIKGMFGNADAAQVRKTIVQYQMMDTLTVEYVNSVIIVINEFIDRKNRQQQQKSRKSNKSIRLNDQ